MINDRRTHPRYVVDGLRLHVDGEGCEILDVSSMSVRVWRQGDETCAPEVLLHFFSEDGFPATSFECRGTFVRSTNASVVYTYAAPLADWGERLPAFDSFLDLRMPALED